MKTKQSIFLLCSLWGLFGTYLSASVPLGKGRDQVNGSRVSGESQQSTGSSYPTSYAELCDVYKKLSQENTTLSICNGRLEQDNKGLEVVSSHASLLNQELLRQNVVLENQFKGLLQEKSTLLRRKLALGEEKKNLKIKHALLVSRNQACVRAQVALKHKLKKLSLRKDRLFDGNLKMAKEQEKLDNGCDFVSNMNEELRFFNFALQARSKVLLQQNAASSQKR